MNVRSLTKKVGGIVFLLSDLGYLKLMFLTETWLTSNSSVLNIVHYAFVSSHRSHGGGVGKYIHSSLKYIIKNKSCNNPNNNIDYLLTQLLDDFKTSFGCIYCPPNAKTADITSVIDHIKSLLNPNMQLKLGGDF